MTRILTVSLVTLGDPGRLTGGYRYHRRMAELAPACGAEVRFVSFPERPFPLPALAGPAVLRQTRAADVLALDSIAAAFLGTWLRRRPGTPVAGSLHQPPGGIDHGPLRRGVQAPLDRLAWRRARHPTCAGDAGSPCCRSATGSSARGSWSSWRRWRGSRTGWPPCTWPGTTAPTRPTAPGSGRGSPGPT